MDHKLHLAKRNNEGKVNLNLAECGRRRHAFIDVNIRKTGAFRRLYDRMQDGCCIDCLQKAKKQGRI